MSTTEQKASTKAVQTIEDVQPDMLALVQLLDALTFLLEGIQRSEDDKELMQADAFARCALRMAQKIDGDIDALVLANGIEAEAAKDQQEGLLQAAQQERTAAIMRAERAEQSLRNITQELDRAHREIDQIKQAGKTAA